MEKEVFEFTAELTEIDESFVRGELAGKVADELKKRSNGKRSGQARWVLFCVLLGALLAAMVVFILFTAQIMGMLTDKVAELEDRLASREKEPNIIVQQIPVQTGNTEYVFTEQNAADLQTNVGQKSLTPSEVYAAYSESVVAIHNNMVTSNAFGQETVLAASGSGFILSEEGYVVTNYHVIEGAEELDVVLSNGEACEAKIVGADSEHDLALLKIEHEGLKPVSVGNSNELVVGETVCAIGNPLGMLTNSLTTGYVSALNRDINLDGTTMNMLQTDCAINEGNSGGPLFDMNGNVIGITTAKYYGTTIEGIGFAIPIGDLLANLSDFMNYGYIRGRAYLGIMIANYQSLDGSLIPGPVVTEVNAGSCAAVGGLKPEDMVVALNEVPISTVTELKSELAKYSAGETITMTVVRGDQELVLTMVLDEKIPEEAALRNID